MRNRLIMLEVCLSLLPNHGDLMMKHWDKIRIFYSVAKAGSFTKAAEQLNACQPALSRSVGLLEHHMKVKLFHRLSRGVSLTSEGAILMEAAESAFHHLDTAELLLQGNDTPQGILRLSTAAASWLLPYLSSFHQKYPELRIQVQDLAQGESLQEAEVILAPLRDIYQDFICRPVATLSFCFYGSGEYLQDNGVPQSLFELSAHPCLMPDENVWPLNWDDVEKPTATLSLTSLSDLANLASQGLGLALLPEEVAHPALVPISLPGLAPSVMLYYCYPPRLRSSCRVTAFYHHLLERE